MRVGDLLGPITMAMRKEVLQGSYIQADETTVHVQRPDEKKGKNQQAYLWQFGNPGGGVVFSFDLGRGGKWRDRFWETRICRHFANRRALKAHSSSCTVAVQSNFRERRGSGKSRVKKRRP